MMDIQTMPHKRTIIFDLDGTLALIHKRRELADLGEGKIDWDKFFDPANIILDTPAEEVIFMAKLLKAEGFKIVIFSGRSARTQEQTEEWLMMAGVKYDELHMRPDDEAGDGKWHFMPDNDLKQHWLDTVVDKNDVYLVFDDRNQVVDMWRANGLKTFQVEPGKF
tara:strand:+ start:9232 stop:9726 length:495 start_codon:yes stop_codon:yes gene_type:complete